MSLQACDCRHEPACRPDGLTQMCKRTCARAGAGAAVVALAVGVTSTTSPKRNPSKPGGKAPGAGVTSVTSPRTTPGGRLLPMPLHMQAASACSCHLRHPCYLRRNSCSIRLHDDEAERASLSGQQPDGYQPICMNCVLNLHLCGHAAKKCNTVQCSPLRAHLGGAGLTSITSPRMMLRGRWPNCPGAGAEGTPSEGIILLNISLTGLCFLAAGVLGPG